MEDTDGGLQPAVDGQSLDEDEVAITSGWICFKSILVDIYML